MQLGEAPALKVLEPASSRAGQSPRGRKSTSSSPTGALFAITRQALINDDTDAFGRLPQMFGRSARNLESDQVWAQITSNTVMGDGVVLFHATPRISARRRSYRSRRSAKTRGIMRVRRASTIRTR